MPSKASSTITGDDATAMSAVPQRIVDAWQRNDADAFADVFAEDGSMILPGDIFLSGRESIRDFMRTAYSGPYRGTRVTGTPVALRRLSDTVAMIITEGGVLTPGETEVSNERAIRATWLLTRHGTDWLVSAYQNTSRNPS